jgi:hypothetical protein
MKSVFLKLIQPVPLRPPFEISNDDLSNIKSEGRKHNLLMLTYSQLQKYRDIISPEKSVTDFLMESKSLYLKSVALSMQQEAVEKEIVALLGGQGIPSVVVRGNRIAQELYNDPNCRTSSDIDILIRMSDALHADSVLSMAGYQRNDSLPLKFWFYRIHHAVYRYPETDHLIEVHWNFGIPSFFRISSEEIWDEVVSADSGRYKLSPGMLVIMLLMHHYMHAFRELRILVDILWALYKYEDMIDWHKLALEVKKIGLTKSTLITLNQIGSLWAETSRLMKSVQTLQQELEGTGCSVPKMLLNYFQMDIREKYQPRLFKDKVMPRLALDKWPVIIFSYLKTLLPVPGAIRELYDSKSKWTLPYDYLRFIKWRLKSTPPPTRCK